MRKSSNHRWEGAGAPHMPVHGLQRPPATSWRSIAHRPYAKMFGDPEINLWRIAPIGCVRSRKCRNQKPCKSFSGKKLRLHAPEVVAKAWVLMSMIFHPDVHHTLLHEDLVRRASARGGYVSLDAFFPVMHSKRKLESGSCRWVRGRIF